MFACDRQPLPGPARTPRGPRRSRRSSSALARLRTWSIKPHQGFQGSSGDKCECRGKRPSPSKKAQKSRDARTKKRKSRFQIRHLRNPQWTRRLGIGLKH